MPSEVSTAGADQVRGRTVEELERELAEAREQQTATSAILRAISNSPTDVQPVLDAVAESAARLCEAFDSAIFRRDGDRLLLVAHHGPIPDVATLPLDRGTINGRAVLDGRTVQVADLQIEADEYPLGSVLSRKQGVRTTLSVPLIREGIAIGTINLRRTEAQLFTERQVALLQTFADQAVIAIENTRLFEAEQARTRELSEALEYQTATSDVLGVISRTPTELQLVLAEICNTACRLCETSDAAVLLRNGDWLRLGCVRGPIGADAEKWPIGRGFVMGRAVLDREVVHVHDLRAVPDDYPDGYENSLKLGHRTIIALPLLGKGEAVGVLTLRRPEVKPFTEKQVNLLRSFADQAVIAIENTRLFEAEQARAREVTERSRELAASLEYQTAAGSVLGIIARSPGQLQPVLDSVVETSARLCRADNAILYRLTDGGLRLAAGHGHDPTVIDTVRSMTHALNEDTVVGRAVLARRTVEIADTLTDEKYLLKELVTRIGVRSLIGVPLMCDGDPIGALALARSRVEPFTPREIEIVTTFADQAVIAIENTRLFEEVQARTRELADALKHQTATSEVLSVISRSKFDLQPVLDTLVQSAVQLCEADVAVIRRRQGETFSVAATHGLSREQREHLESYPRNVERGSIYGRAILEGRTVHVPDVLADPEFKRLEQTRVTGIRANVSVPLMREGIIVGTLTVIRRQPRAFHPKQIELLETFADQAVVAIENTRLFEEIAQKGRELEIASQHKSQFVANMSHELRTPLAAILGYAELMQEGFYEPLGKKSTDALTRIRPNGKHLLGLINTVLDIAKIESGQFSLNLGDCAIESVVETVRVGTESLAETKKLSLKTDVAKRLPVGLGDEQRLTQVLLNLVGNAIKFTDTGEVRIAATAMNGRFTVAVTDTGPGIPQDELKRVFEQFHQIDNSNTKAKGGTGLGLAIAKQIVEMHGGRIWVESTLGKGATFQMELPICAVSHKSAS